LVKVTGFEHGVPVPPLLLLLLLLLVPPPKVAVTARAAVIVVMQVPLPVQAPLQPVKVEPELGVAVRVTVVPELRLALQVVPQLMPAGVEMTVPLPVPALVTVSVYIVPLVVLNVAETDRAWLMVRTQGFVPVQAPPQPAKLEPAATSATRVTTDPLAKLALQVEPQSTPDGVE
jgi:hypothetical protein